MGSERTRRVAAGRESSIPPAPSGDREGRFSERPLISSIRELGLGPARTKGTGFMHVRAFTEQRFGADGWEELLRRLDPSERDVLTSLLAVGWYDLALYAKLIRQLDEVHGNCDFRLLTELGRYEAEQDLNRIYRLFFRLANPGYLIEKTGEYWRRLHDTGSWHIERESGSAVNGRLEGWGVVDSALCTELAAYMVRIVELVGTRDVSMDHRQCRARGDSTCYFRMRWRD